jgi:hypothetical protein
VALIKQIKQGLFDDLRVVGGDTYDYNASYERGYVGLVCD